MRFEKCKMPIGRRRSYGEVQNFIEDFSEAEIRCARVIDVGKTRLVKNVATQINRTAKKMNMPHIVAFTCNGEPYIMNKLIKEDTEE